MINHPRISIALCTYNGEKYLRDQLDSFKEQSLLPYELIACDDCSSDSTFEILEEFSLTAPFPVRLIRNEQNLGLIINFSNAASLCSGDYIAFSDQDDIWLPDKLDVCFKRMQQAEHIYGKDIPLLVHTDLVLIDSEKHIISASYLKLIGVAHVNKDPLRTLLVRNFVLGCTCLCNQVLMKESLPFPDVIVNHDGWCAFIAASRGKILFIPEPKVLYRQHGANVTAWAKSFSYKEYVLSLLSGKLTPDRDVFMSLGLLHQARELRERLTCLSGEIPPYLSTYIWALEKGGIINTLRVMLSRVRHPDLVHNVLFLYRIAKGRHIKYIKDS